jgi:hypothetical protein
MRLTTLHQTRSETDECSVHTFRCRQETDPPSALSSNFTRQYQRIEELRWNETRENVRTVGLLLRFGEGGGGQGIDRESMRDSLGCDEDQLQRS